MTTTNYSKQLSRDMDFISTILPSTYSVVEDAKLGSIRCRSKVGIEDEKYWEKVFQSIKQHFGNRFQEIYHITCTNHLEFIVYLDNKDYYK